MKFGTEIVPQQAGINQYFLISWNQKNQRMFEVVRWGDDDAMTMILCACA
jgi:hypothetical protein